MLIKVKAKAGSVSELTDSVCKVMEPIGYDFTDATIQTLDESVQRQLLADIAEIEEISPTLLNLPLESFCN